MTAMLVGVVILPLGIIVLLWLLGRKKRRLRKGVNLRQLSRHFSFAARGSRENGQTSVCSKGK